VATPAASRTRIASTLRSGPKGTRSTGLLGQASRIQRQRWLISRTRASASTACRAAEIKGVTTASSSAVSSRSQAFASTSEIGWTRAELEEHVRSEYSPFSWILEPMLAGTRLPSDLLDDDLSYVLGLGLVRAEHGELQIANPIYREVIPRALTWTQQISIHEPTEWYVRADGTLDLPKLMSAWQAFWRKDGHLAAEGFGYREAGPHLMLMAFLQRVVNGGGRVEREYGLGRGALDLMIFWKAERYAIEVKIPRDTETETDALDQVIRYLDRAGLAEGWLVMFDLRKELPWTERLFLRDAKHAGRTIRVVGC